MHCFSVYCTETYDYAVNGLEIDDNVEFVLFESNICVSHLIAINEELYTLETKDISHIKSFLHDIVAYCGEEGCKLSESLRRLVEILAPKEFILMSNSVIVSVKYIKSIRSVLSKKFLITMKKQLAKGEGANIKPMMSSCVIRDSNASVHYWQFDFAVDDPRSRLQHTNRKLKERYNSITVGIMAECYQ